MTKKDKSLIYRWKRDLAMGLRTYYFNLASSIFKWDGLPESVPIRVPEKYLYENGLCAYIEPDGFDAMILPVAMQDITKNVYGEPSSWSVTAIGEYAGVINSQRFDNTNSVLIRNDTAYRPSRPYIETIIEQLINVEFTTRMNTNAQKMPFMVKSSESTVLQNKNTIKEFMECEPAFFKTEKITDEFEIYYSNIPFLGKELTALYEQYDARIMTYLGINSLPIEKKERLLVDEVGVGTERRSLVLNNKLNERKFACEGIKRIFNKTVTCELLEELKSDYYTGNNNGLEGERRNDGGENGQIRS